MSDLKPCPFCGGKGVMFTHNYPQLCPTYGVVCELCGTQGPQFFYKEEDAAKYWNHRTEDKSDA